MFNHLYEDLVIATTKIHEDLSEKLVHDSRVAIRSTKSLLTTFEPILQQGPVRSLLAELNWLNKHLAQLRDLDVMKEAIVEFGDTPFSSEIMNLLLDQRSHLEIIVGKELAQGKMRNLINKYFAFSKDIPLKNRVLASSEAQQQATIQRLLVQTWVELFKSLGQVPLNPVPKELHRIRIATKRCRYAFEAAKIAELFTADDQINWAKKLQQVLGQAQDDQTLRIWIKNQDDLPQELQTAALLQIGRTNISSSQLLSLA